MKLLKVVTLILYIQQAYQTEPTKRNVNNNSTMLFSYICDDTILQNVEETLKFLIDENEKLHFKLDTLSMITSSTNLQLTELKTAISNLTTPPRQSQSTNSNSTCTCDHIMDLLRNISDSKSSQKSDMKSILPLPASCAEAFQQSGQQSGIHKIYLPESNLEPFFVYCLVDPEDSEAPWTIIQRRQDGSVDFYREWADYKKGFGNLDGEFFIGLDKLHALTQPTVHELWIQMESSKNERGSANYSRFGIGDSSEAYALKILGSYKGDVGNSLHKHAGQKFSTKDVDNDMSNGNCAKKFTGAWWYKSCFDSYLNGKYMGDIGYGQGIVWSTWKKRSHYVKYVHMAIRPVVTNK